MEYITMIMSGLALLAAIVCLIMIIQEKKRNQKRNADLVNLISAECASVKNASAAAIMNSFKSVNDSYTQKFSELRLEIDNRSTKFDELSTKVDRLEKGIVPDYQEALAAKNSVDEFNRGLSAIMGFDPMEAARKSRQERMGAEVN